MILDLLPDASSYSYKEDPNAYVSERFDSAEGRYSKGYRGIKSFSCQWSLDPDEYVRWIKFFRDREADMDTFQIDLISEDALPVPHVAKFDYPSFRLTQQSGDLFVVVCNLLAKPGEKLEPYAQMITEEGDGMQHEDGTGVMIMERL